MSGETILVIDDGKENRDFIVEYVLQPNDFKPLVARDGREGLEMARQYRPDLILLDLQMPVMNGLEVLDALNAERLEIPVILMTFHGSEEVAIEVYRKGVRDYVKKPYTVEEMYHAIDRSLGEVRLRKEKDQLTERLLASNTALIQRVRELQVLSSIVKNMTMLMETLPLMGRIAEAAVQLISSEEASVYLMEEGKLICKAISRQGEQTYLVDEARSEPLAYQALHEGQTVILSEEQIASARRSNPSAPLAGMAAPLLIGGKGMGALVVKNVNAGTRVFTPTDAGLLSALSDYAAIAYQNASAHAEALQEEEAPGEVTLALRRSVQTSLMQQLDLRQLAREGARRQITVLTLGLQGHLSYAQKAPPERIVTLLNEYLGLAADIIFENQGTIDYVLGDAVLAMFNAPLDQENHAALAVQAALKIRTAVEELHQKQGGGLTFGVGIHSGEAVVGTLGIPRSMSYSAIGDAINFAVYLRRSARRAQILASQALVDAAGNVAEFKPLGQLPAEGQFGGNRVLEVVGYNG